MISFQIYMQVSNEVKACYFPTVSIFFHCFGRLIGYQLFPTTNYHYYIGQPLVCTFFYTLEIYLSLFYHILSLIWHHVIHYKYLPFYCILITVALP